MAIQKEYSQYPEAYWIVSKLTADKRTQTSATRLDVYADAASKQNGDQPVASMIEEWGADTYSEISTGGIPSAYALLKAGLLQGGVDV